MKPQATPLLLLALVAGIANAASDPAADRKSILAMQGEYIVDFAFDETVLLQPGYERAPAMRSGGNETVIVVRGHPRQDRAAAHPGRREERPRHQALAPGLDL